LRRFSNHTIWIYVIVLSKNFLLSPAENFILDAHKNVCYLRFQAIFFSLRHNTCLNWHFSTWQHWRNYCMNKRNSFLGKLELSMVNHQEITYFRWIQAFRCFLCVCNWINIFYLCTGKDKRFIFLFISHLISHLFISWW